jgi:hypothetical protein
LSALAAGSTTTNSRRSLLPRAGAHAGMDFDDEFVVVKEAFEDCFRERSRLES